MTTTTHTPVLLKEVLEGLNPKEGKIYVDATLGGGGHSAALCSLFDDLTIIGIDADKDAISRSQERLSKYPCTLITEVGYNDQLLDILEKHKISKVDGILVDLGMSSDQLDVSKRGFSFQKNEPLLMTMRKEGKDHLTAQEIVNNWREESIADIIYGYGNETYSRRIAKAIVEAREKEPITTTMQLAEIVADSLPPSYTWKKRHPATKTFQALRITVNNEIERLKIILRDGISVLDNGCRFVVITFHSLEDRIVKNFFRDIEREGLGKRINKKALKPTDEEIKRNPRSRSAKVRIFEKNGKHKS